MKSQKNNKLKPMSDAEFQNFLATYNPPGFAEYEAQLDAEHEEWQRQQEEERLERERWQDAPWMKPKAEKPDAKLKRLETELAGLREQARKLTGKELAAAFEVMAEKRTEADTLAAKLTHENAVREQYRQAFLRNSFATAEDFDRVWQTSLRDEAMRREAAKTGSSIPLHEVFSNF